LAGARLPPSFCRLPTFGPKPFCIRSLPFSIKKATTPPSFPESLTFVAFFSFDTISADSRRKIEYPTGLSVLNGFSR
jgi:hypothetical protein